MKKLVTLLIAGVLGVSAFAQELPKNLGIPEKYENYREATQLPHFNYQVGPMLMHIHNYDLDGDGLEDVSELYPVGGFDENGQALITEHPLFYAFELYDKENFSANEVLRDEIMDGLNGNEEWLEEKPRLNLDGVI